MDQLSKMEVFVFIPSKESLFFNPDIITEAFIESLLSVLFNKISILFK